MSRSIAIFSVFIVGLLAFACSKQEQQATLVITNAQIYTVNESQPKAEAVAVIGDTIAYVGDNEGIKRWIGENTEVIDLEGKTMTPGLIEGHAHFIGVGLNKMNLDLLQVKSYEEMLEMVAEAAKNTRPGVWITGRGWHQDKWDSLAPNMVKGFPTHHGLSEVAPDNPVYLSHASGHAALTNAKAMEIAGIANIAKEGPNIDEVEGGEIIKDAMGNPTGIFNENAMGLIKEHIPIRTLEGNIRAAELAMQECLENGITSFQDAGITKDIEVLYRKLAEEGKMKVRLWAMISGSDSTLLNEYYENGPAIGLGNNFLTIRSIKLYTDGALGSRGAWLLEEYTDMPGQFGHQTTPMDYIYKTSLQALESGLQVCTHAIGDRANREVLDHYEKAFNEKPEHAKDHRFRIEHAQHISADDIHRFGQLGVIPAMQAIHMSSDRPWAIERLGQERIVEGAYVWRKLLDSGAKIVNGSDAPVEPVNPLASFYAAVSRKTLAGEPEGGYEPDQKMTRDEALRSYTLDAAYGAFEEDIKGSIEKGKLADFTVFSQNLMIVPEDQILKIQVDRTIVGGKVMYLRNGEASSYQPINLER
ncbi:amidohydrolase [Catalinimonas niigatensis]|uniref:amidohydrolase n=1 Tax=Catalinimonas niigatensis TaxID=1397264 RepID=UPI002665CBC1|nr:amidohydrolase [Catalinimonas niigatensis]WPP50872.1 amidohydrolase [Catalinimonas niigatensis]